MKWDSITLIIPLDSLYNNFKMTTTHLFYLVDKDLEQIQLIITSTKAIILANQAKNDTGDQSIMTRKKKLQ